MRVSEPWLLILEASDMTLAVFWLILLMQDLLVQYTEKHRTQATAVKAMRYFGSRGRLWYSSRLGYSTTLNEAFVKLEKTFKGVSPPSYQTFTNLSHIHFFFKIFTKICHIFIPPLTLNDGFCTPSVTQLASFQQRVT